MTEEEILKERERFKIDLKALRVTKEDKNQKTLKILNEKEILIVILDRLVTLVGGYKDQLNRKFKIEK